jgi:molybdate transport system substrate-binding protein
VVAVLATTGFAAKHAWAEDLSVFAAASLTESLQEIGKTYEEQNPGTRISYNFAASSVLALQIQEGARADVFFSADEAKMNALEKKHLLAPGTRRSLLSNTLVVVVRNDSRKSIASPKDLASSSFGHIALAEPQTVPAGIYAKEWLKKVDLWSKVIDKVVPTENVRAALAAIESGNVDAGVVYKTDAEISKKVRIAYEVPVEEGPVISYPVAAVTTGRNAEAAKRFVDYLASEPALDVFRGYGFRTEPSVSKR